MNVGRIRLRRRGQHPQITANRSRLKTRFALNGFIMTELISVNVPCLVRRGCIAAIVFRCPHDERIQSVMKDCGARTRGHPAAEL